MTQSEDISPTTPPVLAVDLDGTLLQSDMLLETFWAALARDWRTGLGALQALARGKAALKAYLAGISDVDVASLPYNADVIDHVRAARDSGQRTALVTASNQMLADRIAAHVDVFDEVFGSDDQTNLKGDHKAAFLTRTYGHGGFVYMGDAQADLPVWRAAAQAITVNAPTQLRAAAEAASARPALHLGGAAPALPGLVRAMRPHQWLKNLLVFVPMLAAHDLSGTTILATLLAFLAFSLVASSVYLLNDLLDLAADRAHPRKRLRPFASGEVPLIRGTLWAPGLLAAGVLIAASVGWLFLLTMVLYYVTTLAYSFGIKRRAVIDICALAGLYTLRIVAGGAATGIPLSVWLLAFSIFFFFALAAVKRQAELVDGLAAGRASASGRAYEVGDLPLVSQMALSSGYVSVLVMALYLNSPTVQTLYPNPAPLWGICLILLYWLSRVVMKTHRGVMHDDPVVFAVKDRVSLVCGVLIMICALLGTFL